MSNHVQKYLEDLRDSKGDRFVQELYEALKAEHFEQTALPPVPGRPKLRPEHDIRSRAPGLYQNEQPIEDTGFYGRSLRYKP